MVDLRAQNTQQLAHGEDIHDTRYVGNDALAAAKNGGGKDRQRGILRPADLDLPSKRYTACDDSTIHRLRPYVPIRSTITPRSSPAPSESIWWNPYPDIWSTIRRIAQAWPAPISMISAPPGARY